MLLNLADMRTVHSREALASLREQLGERVLDTVACAPPSPAPRTDRPSAPTSILDHRPDLGADYVSVAGELLARMPGFEEARGRLVELGSAPIEQTGVWRAENG